MNTSQAMPDRADIIGPHLPFLRRYARALAGSQEAGDAIAAATLEAILQRPSAFASELNPKVALFRVFHRIWHSGGAPTESLETGPLATAHAHLSRLTPNSREAVLMSSIEGFSTEEIAEVLEMSPRDAEALVRTAFAEMEDATRGKVLIIEDEAIIAVDLAGLVADIGHTVTHVARTRDKAVELGRKDPPDLILADIQLADNSSGIDAVKDLLAALGDIPVIFITAFPEQLLTGERPEPTFLITKPYSEAQVRTSISQAMFFASTATLTE